MDQPGTKFLEAIKATEADMWIKTYGKKTQQLSTLKDNGIKYESNQNFYQIIIFVVFCTSYLVLYMHI